MAPYLALIGDIGCVKDPDYLSFLERELSKFKIVFLVSGNHEPFHSSWATTKRRLKQFENDIAAKNSEGNLGFFVLMDQTRYDISPNLTVLGCTLFSDISPSQKESVSLDFSDFHRIENWTVDDHNQAFLADFAWLNAQVRSIADTEPERKIIILTHHSPTRSPETINPAHSQSRITSGFSTDLSGEFVGLAGMLRCGHLDIRILTAILLTMPLGKGSLRIKGDMKGQDLMRRCVLSFEDEVNKHIWLLLPLSWPLMCEMYPKRLSRKVYQEKLLDWERSRF
jgi:hypothetical protein